ncbi:hypothetical protein QQS21_009905 [Conoideocrella luteorostrata]|uniref:C2H2-type domain-containing protein n=1 Tax=Conoideocrella luteorostrata TaxID=1105319 RepID=A0AAJ0CKH7_9HYPO|nr:hypothetical protein QQS21_009905 [Conoideocrella luteorostrata]
MVELLHDKFEGWVSMLRVRASYDKSLDKRLEYSDDVQHHVVELLELIRLSLDIITAKHLQQPQHDRPGWPSLEYVLKIEVTPEDAVDVLRIIMEQLRELVWRIYESPISSINSRYRAVRENRADEKYIEIAMLLVNSQYSTAAVSLRSSLALSMEDRRQRLQYIRRHSQYFASMNNGGWPLLTESPPIGGSETSASTSADSLGSHWEQESQLSGDSSPSVTSAPSFGPWQFPVIHRKRGNGGAVVSSSKGITTEAVESLDNYPEPPVMGLNEPYTSCPFCFQRLSESDLTDSNWRQHVNNDLKPFVCISKKCLQPVQAFETLDVWAKHMREEHSSNKPNGLKWTQLMFVPCFWQCASGHPRVLCKCDAEFDAHLTSEHGHCDDEELSFIVNTAMRRQRRIGEQICPFCDDDVSEENQPGSAEAPPNPSNLASFEHPTKLDKHIAGHLLHLAFESVKGLDAGGDDHTSSFESIQSIDGEEAL